MEWIIGIWAEVCWQTRTSANHNVLLFCVGFLAPLGTRPTPPILLRLLPGEDDRVIHHHSIHSDIIRPDAVHRPPGLGKFDGRAQGQESVGETLVHQDGYEMTS
jgi:hypothetical protein